MASNRIYLIHRPTGAALYLGKRMGWGWYDFPEKADIAEFFWRIETGDGDWLVEPNDFYPRPSQDDIVVALEDARAVNGVRFDPRKHKLPLRPHAPHTAEPPPSSILSRFLAYFRR